MKFYNLFIFLSIILISSNLYSSPMNHLKTTEEKIFNLVNKKLKNGSLEDKKRNKDIENLLDNIIAYNKFSKNCLRGKNKKTGKSHWKSITKEEQNKFSTLFKQLIREAWLKELKKFNKEDKVLEKGKDGRVTYKDEKVKGKLGMVYTTIKADGEITNVDFRFWDNRITDFIIDDLSVTRRYRKSFSKHINKKGFDSLLKKMEDKLKELKNEKK